MARLLKGIEWFYHFLGSKKLAASLFMLLCAALIPGTFTEATDIHLSTVPSMLFGCMGLNLFLCTIRRIKTLSRPVLIMHLGTILIFGGVVISSFGFVATVHVYEGTTVDSAFRWDAKRDMPLGVDLTVKKINIEYYPVPVKVGVLRGKEKVGLFELKTGGRFSLDRYKIRAEALEMPSENLRISVFDGENLLGTADTSGARDLPQDFPYDFKLVAYKTPFLKRVWVDLSLSRNSQVVAEGTSEVNSPLTWEKSSYHMTKVDADRFALRYAGIQITNDPGKPYLYAGFGVLGIGSVLYFVRRLAKAAA